MAKRKQPLISINMGTFNRGRLVNECLQKLSALDEHIPGEYEIVVVNNYSTDDTHERLHHAKSYFKDPETLQIYSQKKYKQEHKTFTTAQIFLTRGKFSQTISDDDYYDIDAFVDNIKSLKSSTDTILSRQITVDGNPIVKEPLIHEGISKGKIDEFLFIMIMNSSFDYYEMAIMPSEITYIPGCTFYEEYKMAMALKSIKTGNIIFSNNPYYHRVDNCTYEGLANNKKASDHLGMYSSINNLPASEILLAQVRRDFKLDYVENILKAANLYPLNYMMGGYYMHHCFVALQKKNYAQATHYQRRLRLYREQPHFDNDLYFMYTCADVFLIWARMFFMVNTIVIPFESREFYEAFLQVISELDPNFFKEKEITTFYDVSENNNNKIVIVLNASEKALLIKRGAEYPGLIFCIEDVFNYYKLKNIPFNMTEIYEDYKRSRSG